MFRNKLYNVAVKTKLPASQFRKELFNALDAAQHGEEITVTYKGQEYALNAKRKPSKFAHMKPRPGAVLDWNAFVAESSWDEAAWNAKWGAAPRAKKTASHR